MKGGRVSYKDAYFQFQKNIFVAFSFIGIVTFFVFSFIHLNQGNTFIGIFELTAASIAALNLVFFVKKPKEEPYSTILLIVLLSAYFMLIVTGGIENTGIIWIHSFPVAAFALKRRKIGGAWITLFISSLTVLAVLQEFTSIHIPYSFIELRQNIISVSILALLIYFYARFLEEREGLFIEQDKKLIKLNARLKSSLFAVKKERAKVQAFINSIGNGIVAVDKAGKVILANPASISLLGCTRKDLANKTFFSVVQLVDIKGVKIPKKERPGVQVLRAKEAMTVSSPANHPHYFKKQTGEAIPVAIAAAPIIIDGNVEGAMISFRDITEEVRFAREKTEFVSITSHQLRTPLTGIKWTLELLEQERMRKSAKEAMKEASVSVESMIKLVSDLLNVSRIELGTMKIEAKKNDVIKLIRSIIKEVEPLAVKQDIEIEFIKPPGKVPSILIDANLYRQVLHNLLTNAIRYSAEKSSKVIVSFDPEEQAFVTTVKDFGIGIEKMAQEKIFQKYYRSDKARKISSQGTGLGLYFAKMATIAMGGEIGFTSEEGKGSEFYVKLPLKIGK